MALENLQEDLFKSIDTIVQSRIANLPYDKTIECEVIKNDKRANGIYTVKYQGVTFEANSLVENLNLGDIVYVSVPQNDFTKEKIILIKKIVSVENPVKILPFLKFVKGSNLFTDMQSVGEYSIPINNGNTQGRRFYFTMFNGEDTAAGYTRLGVKMTVNADIEQELISGDYGLKITIFGYRQTQTDKTASAALSESSVSKYSEDFWFTTKDMISTNPFKTHGYQNQEKVFNIEGLVIDSIVVSLYQNDNFKDSYNSKVVNSRIYFTNLQLYLGYDIQDFENSNTRLYIYTKDGWLYNELNAVKTLYARIITKSDKDNFYIDSSNLFSSLALYRWGQYNINSGNTQNFWGNKYGYEEISSTPPSIETTKIVTINYNSSEIQAKYCLNLHTSTADYVSNELFFTKSIYKELVYDITDTSEFQVTTVDGIMQMQGDSLFFKTKDGVTVLKLNTVDSQLLGNASTASSAADYIENGQIHKNLQAIKTAIQQLGGTYNIV